MQQIVERKQPSVLQTLHSLTSSTKDMVASLLSCMSLAYQCFQVQIHSMRGKNNMHSMVRVEIEESENLAMLKLYTSDMWLHAL